MARRRRRVRAAKSPAQIRASIENLKKARAARSRAAAGHTGGSTAPPRTSPAPATPAKPTATARKLGSPKTIKKVTGTKSAFQFKSRPPRAIKPVDPKKIPVGKNVLLYHRTKEEAAKSIVAQQQFRPHTVGFQMVKGNKMKVRVEDPKALKVWFVPAASRSGDKFYKGFGTGVVSVTVPRKLLKPDNATEYSNYHAVTVDLKHLQGRKIRRHL